MAGGRCKLLTDCLICLGGRPHPNPPPEGEGIFVVFFKCRVLLLRVGFFALLGMTVGLLGVTGLCSEWRGAVRGMAGGRLGSGGRAVQVAHGLFNLLGGTPPP